MEPNKLRIEKGKAFQMFAEGKSQKAISQALGVSEKTIGKWKTRFKWVEKLTKAGIDKNQPLFLLLPEIDEKVSFESPEAVKKIKTAIANINKNLLVIQQVLTKCNLIEKP